MATFPSITPTYGQQKRSAPNTKTIRFADGYEHRILFGLAAHQNPKVYNFTFTPPGEGFTKTGTNSQSGTTVTITISSHGVAVGDELTIDYTSGSATDGTFLVVSVTDSNVFTVTAAASATNSGNVSITLSGAGQYVCENWNKSIPYNNRATIQATFREVFEP